MFTLSCRVRGSWRGLRLRSRLTSNTSVRQIKGFAEALASADDSPDARSDNCEELAERLRSLEAERDALRRALATSESRYRLIVESAVDYAIIATDLEGIVTTWNDAAEEALGWSAGQIIGRSISTIFTPEDVAEGIPEQEMRLAMTMGKARDERYHTKADGTRFFASGEMMPLLGDGEEHVGFIKILRDRTRQIEERQELETNRERLRLALASSAIVGTWDWDVKNDIIYADRRFAVLYGVDPEIAEAGVPIALYLNGIHPDDREKVGAGIEQAMAEGGAFDMGYRTIDRDGTVRWVTARGRCYMDEAGRPLRFPGVAVDRTAERSREARQAALLKLGDELQRADQQSDPAYTAISIVGETLEATRVGYAVVDPAETHARIVIEWVSENSTPLTGTFPLEDFGPDYVAALRTGTAAVADVATDPRIASHSQAWQNLDIAAFVNMVVQERGRLRVIFYVTSDRPREWNKADLAFIREVLNRTWTFDQRRRAEQALVETETRLRLAHEAADIGSFDYDLENDTLVWDDRCRAVFGVSPGAPVSYSGTFVAGLHPEDRAATEAAVAAVLDPGSNGEFDIVYRTIGIEDGVLRYVHASGQTIVSKGKTIRFVGAVQDITEEKLAEERQQLLTRELQHRVKNTLAMVSALANQTLRRATDVQDGLQAFSTRLIALGKAHDILTQTSWTSAPISAIVESALATHRPQDEERLRASGPSIRLTAKQSLALSLALHELATNAAKYGALSNDTGRVIVEWSLTSPDGERKLGFVWREVDGPPVTPPQTRGFGSRLVEQSLAVEFGGDVEMDFRPEGLVCRIDAPMTDDAGEE